VIPGQVSDLPRHSRPASVRSAPAGNPIANSAGPDHGHPPWARSSALSSGTRGNRTGQAAAGGAAAAVVLVRLVVVGAVAGVVVVGIVVEGTVVDGGGTVLGVVDGRWLGGGVPGCEPAVVDGSAVVVVSCSSAS